ncbi:MAG: hypothetical protein J07HX64_01756 [halophilic archaeon J07HX64]|jgi:Bacterial regulatory protein, arsR family.|nr:MAG: hypothetical protein J07HX64_01756 [halophilic archaeon J07HX64]
MSSIFPLRDTVTRDEDREPRLVDLDEETADEVFEALSSGTTRSIFLSLHQNPQTASDLADETETSVQNVQYHIGKLKDADLVEVVDTWYSERGTEMKVYAPKDDSLVLFAGRDKQSTLRSLLNRVAGVLTLLVPASVLAGLGARWTTGTQDGGDQTIPVETTTSDPGGDSGVDTGGDRVSQDAGGAEDVLTPSNQSSAETSEAATADSVVMIDNDTAYVVEGEIGETANESIFLMTGDTDPGSNATIPAETVDNAADTTATIAGLDPGLAVGAGVLLGGLLVAGGLAAWYGLPTGSVDPE